MSERDNKYQLRDPMDEQELDEFRKQEKERLLQELKKCELDYLLLRIFVPIIAIILFIIFIIIHA